MPVAILYPRYDHPAIEEWYASWQSQSVPRHGGGHLLFYDVDERASDAAADIEADYVLTARNPG